MSLVTADPPLVPSPDDARDELRRELLHPEYQQDLLDRLLERVERMFDGAVNAAAGAGPLALVAALVVFLLLLLAVIWLVTRARPAAQLRRAPGPVLAEEHLTAADLRLRAESALRSGRLEDAVVDGVRALTVRQVERGRLDDVPDATAREVTAKLAAEFPDRAPRLEDVARLFDAVLYGDQPATSADATSVLALDDDLAGAR